MAPAALRKALWGGFASSCGSAASAYQVSADAPPLVRGDPLPRSLDPPLRRPIDEGATAPELDKTHHRYDGIVLLAKAAP
jgi:hypothetical protein